VQKKDTYTQTDYKKNIQAERHLKAVIFPNPVQSTAHLSLSNNVYGVNITITDVSGRVVYRSSYGKESNIAIPTKNLSAGVYFVEIKDNQQSVVIKMIRE